ncbi:MAG: UDP-N-acetylglucosamine 2-epimerase (non-hydrolyzing) [Planctomycetota bacterium]
MSEHKLKVLTILGTRPEIIRLARVMAALDLDTHHQIVHTGQNYDYELNQIFFDDLGIRKPDHFLGVDTSSLGSVLGGILIESEKVLRAEKPDAVLILGDTNSAIAGIIARRLKIPIYHMEAGNRCFDFNVPEETNRRIVDHISDFNLVYTEHARRHLLAEGIPHRRIYLTGSPMREVLNHYRNQINASDVLKQLEIEPHRYLLVSMHREENVDYETPLRNLLVALESLAIQHEMPIIVSTHPRTRKRLDALGYKDQTGQIQFLKPFGFSDYNHLQMKSFCTISDSGTISEESSILEFPAVTIRNALERPEALDCGCITMAGTNPDRILDCVSAVTRQFSAGAPVECPAEYQIENTSQRVVRLILGTAKLAHRWQGIENQNRC